jgi:dihydropteroate synthase
MFTLESGERQLPIIEPLIMGVINLTPDSFYQASRVSSREAYESRIDQMVSEGVQIIDLGGQSSRPGAVVISADKEYERISGALEYTIKKYPNVWVSIDTFYASVAQRSLEKGAHIINDISAGNIDKSMLKTVADHKACYVCMHMKGDPQTMQRDPTYADVTQDILDFFNYKLNECKNAGVKSIIIDPGFGFGKQLKHNYKLLQNLDLFVELGFPVLTGFSRKSMIYKLLEIGPNESLNGTSVLNTIALMKGVSILRVHDIKEAIECIKIINAYNEQ